MLKIVAPARRNVVSEQYVRLSAKRNTSNVVELVRDTLPKRPSAWLRLREYLNEDVSVFSA